jgi:hypothetical protein
MLVETSVGAEPESSFIVPDSLFSDEESLTNTVPSVRQNASASSVSTRLQFGQRFIFKMVAIQSSRSALQYCLKARIVAPTD